MKLDFFCLGAQKAGTTSLHDILKKHTDIFLPDRKEAHFFDNEKRYSKGLEWYNTEFFSNYNNEKIIGTFTPEYCFYPKVPKRIFESFGGNIKFIFILRQPVERAISHYNMSKGRMYENLSFNEAIEKEPERILKGDFEYNHFSYLSRGLYIKQIKRYLEYFPIENFLFLDFNTHIVNDIYKTINRIQFFLDVPIEELDNLTHSNKAFEFKKNIFTKLILDSKKKNIKGLLKNLIPEYLRKKLVKKILQTNKTDNKAKFELSKIESSALFKKYFLEEIEDLEKLTKLNLAHWYS